MASEGINGRVVSSLDMADVHNELRGVDQVTSDSRGTRVVFGNISIHQGLEVGEDRGLLEFKKF